MGNQASSEAQKALECCTAVDVDDEGEHRNGDAGDPRRKVVRDMCHGTLGESLFTECLDERSGNRNRPGRSKNGSVAGSRASRGSGEGGQEPGWCGVVCLHLLHRILLSKKMEDCSDSFMFYDVI